VVLLSGGLDSAANLAFCLEKDEVVLAVTVDYGQKASVKEIEASKKFCEYYNVTHKVIDLKWLGQLGQSALTKTSKFIPKAEEKFLDSKIEADKLARSVWVPNRNGVLIQLAAAYAEDVGSKRVVVGFNYEEAQTFPDNSMEFISVTNRALAYSTSNQVEVFSFTENLNKKEIVVKLKKKIKRPFPFEYVWSCYDGKDYACGVCESCLRLKRAMRGGL